MLVLILFYIIFPEHQIILSGILNTDILFNRVSSRIFVFKNAVVKDLHQNGEHICSLKQL